MTELNAYHLRRWAVAVYVRDGFRCQVCGRKFRRGSGLLQAHHVKPKALYPELAYELDNGVAVCAEHHQPLVHTADDSWKRWVPMFRRWVRLKAQKEFNEQNQSKIRRIR